MLDKPEKPPLTNNEGANKCPSIVDKDVTDGLGTGLTDMGVATISMNENEGGVQGGKRTKCPKES